MNHQYKQSFHLSTLFIALFLLSSFQKTQAQTDHPNILLIIADDMGVDVLNGYHQPNLLPSTPTLDSLRSVGITFDNVFAAPKCSPTRAAILSGKYGIKTGVTGTPGNLTLDHPSIFTELAIQTNNEYADAAFGKWHLTGQNPNHALDHNADAFMGFLDAAPEDYYAWSRTENGVTAIDSSYATSTFTDASIDWINDQNQPWLLWLAHASPHGPIHLPPDHMYTLNPTGTNYRKYLTMIESVDYEINRLLYSIPDDVRENTLIIFIGDNGTPSPLMNDYPPGHGKSTVYQGGIRVPMIIAGAGVTRQGERESALVHVTDLYATILEVTGAELQGGLYNSLSFSHLLTGDPGPTRDYNYSEIIEAGVSSWTMRGPQYKLIQFVDNNTQEMYDLFADSLEFNNLLTGTLTTEQQTIKADLEAEALQTRTSWSCRDHIRNGDEDGIDCGGSQCAPCTSASTDLDLEKLIKVFPNPAFDEVRIEIKNQLIESVAIYNSMGQLLRSQLDVNAEKAVVDLTGIVPQMLYFSVRIGEQMEVLKVVKF